MLNSINTNIAAYSAQSNIGKASNSASASIARLSSGARITKASDDVAALSIGTSLKTGVTTLRQALANTSQGTSLLQVADAALGQISDILQRQKAIATQANSGTLSDTERGYLNQEFQALKSQIDQIAGSTSFSSVKLLNGSLAGSTKVDVNQQDVKLAVPTAPTTLLSLAGGFDVGDVLTINGVDITAVASGAVQGTQVDVATYDTTLSEEGTAQAALLATTLNASTDHRLNKFYFTSNGTNLQVQVRAGHELANRDDATITWSMEEAAVSPIRTPQTIMTLTGNLADEDQFTINGVTIDLENTTPNATNHEMAVGVDAATTLANLANLLNNSVHANLTGYTFSATATQLQVIRNDGASTAAFTMVENTDGGTVATVVASTTWANTTGDTDVTASGSISLVQHDRATAVTVSAGNASDGDKITVNGMEVTFTNATLGTASAAGKVKIGADNVQTAANLAAFLNASADARLSNFYFDTDGAGVVRASLATGAVGGTAGLTVTSTIVTGANFIAASNAVNDTYSLDGLGENRTRALGTVNSALLSNGGGTAGTAGSPIDLSGIRNNDAFIGKLGGSTIGKFTATYTAEDTVAFSIKVGDVTYSSAAMDLSNTAATSITLNGTDANGKAVGGSFSISIAGGAVATASIGSQASADSLASRLNESFNGVTFAQSRDVTSFSTGTTVKVAGVEVARLDNVSIDLRSDDFSSIQIQSFDIASPAAGRSDAVFTAVINGETYTSLSGIGSTFDNNRGIQLQSTTNPNRVLTIVTSNNDIAASNAISMDVSNEANAAAVATAFRTALGLDNAGSALNFQIGAAASDSIGVKINDVSTATLYNGASPDITTIEGAQAAAGLLDTAIGNINKVRADVGALMSRLDFTAANLQASIQNQDAARGTLLDTDVAAESTAYATAQVQLQAGIAVLAQANQLPQNLLKLIS